MYICIDMQMRYDVSTPALYTQFGFVSMRKNLLFLTSSPQLYVQ